MGATFTLKTSLVGAWPPAQGCVRLDGDDLRHYGPDQLGTALQDIELFSGCVRDNIARFRADAARCAGDRGGNTRLCARNDPAPPQRVYDQPREDGVGPSGGQRQRSVSRALFGKPSFVVLDEPDSNLDSDGNRAQIDPGRRRVAERRKDCCDLTQAEPLSAVDRVIIQQEGVYSDYASSMVGQEDPHVRDVRHAMRQ
ncbi:hypothetical protein NKH93_21265 [Mesorhizobium sp. M0954]|uniref:hypothetical protein n=1 Tax=Mesorhizobium sp. M0954 TaxID=2957032 RepID=UPI003336BB65